MKQKLLIFHRIIAPYRIDFFNYLYDKFDTRICLYQTNLLNQKFDYELISKQFLFSPKYLLDRYLISGNRFKKHVWKEMKDFNPNIILVSECGQDSVQAILYKHFCNKECKIISMIDDSYDMIANNHYFSRMHKYAERIIVPLLDNIVNVEPRVAELFQKKYNKGIFFPIIQEDNKLRAIFHNSIPISTQLIQKYSLQGKKVLLYVGRLVELKNLQRIIPVFKKINHPDWIFVLVGDGEYRSKLERIAGNSNNIVFVGRFEGDKLYAWYNISDILILASTQEAFGAVTNEALLAGNKVLVSRLAGSQCLVNEGINGYTIDPYDPADIESKMIILMKDVQHRDKNSTLRVNQMPKSFDDYFFQMLTKWGV